MTSDTPLLTIGDYPGLCGPHGDGVLRLGPGEMIVVRGKSGAGKSRLLRRMIDLDPEPVGDIRFRGTAVSDIPCAELRRRVTYMPQDPVRFEGTGQELIERVRQLLGNRDHVAPRAALQSWLDALDLTDVVDRPMLEYSGGENRRVALVNALQLSPEVLLLDEPTSGLDEQRMGIVNRIIADRRANGTAVVWVTYDGGTYDDAQTFEVKAA
ncbi:MAG: ATP-binding protein [Planctomycetes bacterium]|jgi:putative ABC transport system ATP-binding protein|nr:ATP-binding protein [Planctomycetota bacterium]